MAIYTRDRSFQQIISDIDITTVNTIPLKFLQEIIFILDDGSTVIVTKAELTTHNADNLESLVKDIGFNEKIADITIKVDFDNIEADVNVQVDALLNR